MATDVNNWNSYELDQKVRDIVWGGRHKSSSKGRGGRVTWEPHSMDVKAQLISAPEPLTCTERKQRERMAELQERRRSLQALLSTRLAELRRICIKEAELTGAVPSEFPLDVGEKPPDVQRRGGTAGQGNRKCQEEDDDSHRSKPKKNLFSGALRKHTSEHSTHTQTHTHHGKRTVHRGCHTDDAVRSESSSMSDSTGLDNDDGVSQGRPLLFSSASPTEVFYQNKNRKSSFHTRVDHPTTHKPPPLPPSHPPPPPPRSQDSSSSSDPASGWEGAGRTACRSNGSDVLLECIIPPQEEGVGQQGVVWVNGQQTNTAGTFQNCETVMDGWTMTNNGVSEPGETGVGQDRGRGRRGAGYGELLLDYVWGKRQQLQRQQSQTNKQPITAHHLLLLNGSSSQLPGAPPTYRSHIADQRRVTVTRTKSCGPFLHTQPSQTDPTPPTVQPDPHPHLLPPRPPQLPLQQDSQLEDATRSLHKALALEGLRDWYLRNTLGSSHHQTSGKVMAGANNVK
ncbi:uncharacterized protein ccdc120a, partial [Xenentodon cancila]